MQTQHAKHKTNNIISHMERHSTLCSATIYICGIAILINDHYESILQFPSSKGVLEDTND